jgi:uncharacterized membrane protein YdbT with pleckstrin-like domain
MGILEKNLLTDESVVATAKLHWSAYGLAWLMLAGGVGLIALNSSETTKGLGSFLIIVSFFPWLRAFIERRNTEFALTNRRLLSKSGWITRNLTELLLVEVEGLTVEQGAFGRMLGFGSLRITGRGGAASYFTRIGKPMEFRRAVQEQLEEAKKSG